MSKKLKRDDYDELDRALNEVQGAEESGRVGSHASMRAELSRGEAEASLPDRPFSGRFRMLLWTNHALARKRSVCKACISLLFLLLRSSWQLREVSR